MATKVTKQTRNPTWNEDELILALDLYVSSKPRDVQKHSNEVHDLSVLLNRLHVQLGTTGRETLRNPAGVYMKLQNLKSHDPEYVLRGHRGLQRGNRLEGEIWSRFGTDAQHLHGVAQAIRAFIESGTDLSSAEVDDDALASEGRLLTRVHKTYERRPENRRRKIAEHRRENGGRVFCECYGFDFERTYGERGAGFIECHHAVAVSLLSPNQRLKLSDLRLLCSNCHRMIHRVEPWLTTSELSALLRRNAEAAID